MSKEELRPKPGNEDREITIRKRSSGLSRLLLAISITLLAFVILLQPSTVNLDTSLSHDGESKTALILTAHPDDEVMFFTPTILALLAAGWDVGALCLSNGQWFIMVQRGSDGLGRVREEELYKAYERLGVPPENVTVLNDPYVPLSVPRG
jgi:N-acetylglucosaminylphosphatidylinositol deacetylase